MSDRGPVTPGGNLDDVVATAPAPPPAPVAPTNTAPYINRIIGLTFQLGTGSFGGGTSAKPGDVSTAATAAGATNTPNATVVDAPGASSNKMEVLGLRCHVRIFDAQTPEPAQCQIRVYGLTLQQMNQLTNAGNVYAINQGNSVGVQAGDANSGMTTLYNGTIIEAYPDFSSQPDVSFVVIAVAGGKIRMQPVPPVSFDGPTPVTTALQRIIQPAGLTLEAGSNTNAVLQSPYFPGTAWQQVLTALRASNLFGYLDTLTNRLAVWAKNGSRPDAPVLISPETGMIGYPEFEQLRIRVRILFYPSFHPVRPGMRIQVKSQLTAASGLWTVNRIHYNLASETPDGPWEIMIEANPVPGGASTS